jgi:hypothetical protein
MPKGKTPSEESYTFKCEIFSYGMLLWELCAQKFPYKNMEMKEIMAHVKSKDRETFEDFNNFTSSNGLYPYDNRESIAKGFIRIIESGEYIYYQVFFEWCKISLINQILF